MHSKRFGRRCIVGLIILLVAAAVFFATRSDRDQVADARTERASGSTSDVKGMIVADTSLKLRGARSASDAKEGLLKLELSLRSLAPDVAAQLLTAELEGGDDFKLPMEFKVGSGGFLSGQPSWRVALLDLLGKIDPAAAASYAKVVLEQPTQPDEWAIALRNYARGESGEGSSEFLREKTEEMINQATWKADPSVGYLEAFDVLVHIEAADSTPTLASLVGDRSAEGKTVAHAAFLTLDRLTLAAPERMFEALSQQTELFETRGPMVANFYARADLREPGQRGQVERYLLDPDRRREELEAFAGVYPNNNQMISENLLTRSETAKGADLVAHDRDALAVVEAWLRDPRFADPKLRPYLQTMHRRLTTFVRQAGGR
jgi:hypothetical protein